MTTTLAVPSPRGTRPARPLDVTPYLRLDVEAAARRYAEVRAAFPRAAVHYAVKANPHPALLRRLAADGASFDVAGRTEVEACLTAGADPADLLWSNPVARRDELASAYAAGVRTFVVDGPGEVDKLAAAAPGAQVLGRLVTSGAGSDWPLSRKFGQPADALLDVLEVAGERGLTVAGVSFHVGSQQRDPAAWVTPVAAAARLFTLLRALGHRPWLLDLGGGLPADHHGDHPDLAAYAAAVLGAVDRSFGADRPQLVLEPGRGVVGDAGVLVAGVLGVVHRGGRRWVHLDAGVYTGLVETLDEAIRYRLRFPGHDGESAPAVLAGPTCDSTDVLYESVPVPMALAEGDRVEILAAGAYTTCYSTVGFNGFAPLPTRLS